ncbi:hypothetical protein IWZ03DRAFT_26580 [Phyllosticta citriasiana]|uniref:Secreted protein n=1 Tax=Phyllosticta citriasiana TaxID=595635 RepID=A0ABR1L0D3_9PEZI
MLYLLACLLTRLHALRRPCPSLSPPPPVPACPLPSCEDTCLLSHSQTTTCLRPSLLTKTINRQTDRQTNKQHNNTNNARWRTGPAGR